MLCNLPGGILRIPELFLQLILSGDHHNSYGCRSRRRYRQPNLLRLVSKQKFADNSERRKIDESRYNWIKLKLEDDLWNPKP
jgi:hypothetical protein